MLEKLKNLSAITKIFYLFALILFITWVIPTIGNYYDNISTYQKSSKELERLSSEYELSTQEEKFSEDSFMKQAKPLFSNVAINALDKKKYEVTIRMKPEDLKKFYNFIETISLRYPVKLKDDLNFTVNNKIITAKMQLIAF